MGSAVPWLNAVSSCLVFTVRSSLEAPGGLTCPESRRTITRAEHSGIEPPAPGSTVRAGVGQEGIGATARRHPGE